MIFDRVLYIASLFFILFKDKNCTGAANLLVRMREGVKHIPCLEQ